MTIGVHVFVYTYMRTNSALHPCVVAKLSTSFGWGNGGNVSSAGWQVTLCDRITWVAKERRAREQYRNATEM